MTNRTEFDRAKGREAQRRWRERRKDMTPLQKVSEDQKIPFAYTPDEAALADLIRLDAQRLEERATALNRMVSERLAREKGTPALRMALASFTRIQVPNH